MPDDDAALTPKHVPSPHGSAPDIEESSSESAEEGVESIGDAHEATCGDADEDESEGLTADPFMDRIFKEVMALRKAKAAKKKKSAQTFAVSSVVSNTSHFQIPLQVPCGQTVKELSVWSDTTWAEMLIAVGKKMVHDPCSLRLGYMFSWNEKGKKETPMSLENEEEWVSLTNHI